MISVVMPAYRSAGTIVEALRSVVAQELTTEGTEIAEVIVVDDCSPDSTCEIVEEWNRATVHGAPSLRLVRLPKNGGPAVARNAGIREAKGEWIAFLDADDAWLPERLDVQMRVVAENPDAVMVCGKTVRLTTEHTDGTERELIGSAADRLRRSEHPSPPSATPRHRKETKVAKEEVETREIEIEEFVDVNPVSTSTVLVRTSVLEQVGGFDEQFRGPEDLDLWMRIARQGQILQVRQPLSRYREVEGSLSNEVRTFLPQVLAVYEKAFSKGGALSDHPEWRKRAIGSRYVSACWTELACGRPVSALKFLAKSVVLWPWRLHGEKRKPFWRWILLAKIVLNRA